MDARPSDRQPCHVPAGRPVRHRHRPISDPTAPLAVPPSRRRRLSGPSPLSPAPSAKHAEPLPLPLPAAPGVKALVAADAEAHAAHVPIAAGRPDVRALLARVAEEAGVGAGSDDAARRQPLRVGVFVAGPAVLVEGVLDTCADLNGLWDGRDGRAFLEVKALTHEL